MTVLPQLIQANLSEDKEQHANLSQQTSVNAQLTIKAGVAGLW